jgi:hypothetical protein
MAGISQATANAYARRVVRADTDLARFQWFIREVSDKVSMTMEQRVRMATAYLLSKVVKNISVPVVKATRVSTRKVYVIERSKPGEFPRADTTQLLKTTFSDVKKLTAAVTEGYVGTTLDYGLILETKMNRKFLTRTLQEEQGTIQRMLTGPIK